MTFEEKIEYCIACPIAHQIIFNYYDFYRKYTEYDKELCYEKNELKRFKKEKKYKLYNETKEIFNKHKELSEDITTLVKIISTILKIKGTTQEQCKYLKQLTNSNLKNEVIINGLEEHSCFTECVIMLHQIFAKIKIFLDKETLDYENTSNERAVIIDTIKAFLEKNGIAIKATSNPNNKHKKYDENCAIIKTYKNAPSKDIKYEYCNPLHYTNYTYFLENCSYDKFIKIKKEEIEIEELEKFLSTLRNCSCDKFIKIKNEEINKFAIYNKINHLKKEYKNIIYQYLLKAPKNISFTLRKVKEIQNLSYNEIGILFYKEKKDNTRSAQYLINNNDREYTNDEIKMLSKIFLVSEDVIKYGVGKIYGKWEDISDVEEIKKIAQIIVNDNYNIEKDNIDEKSGNINTKDTITDFEKELMKFNFYKKENISLYTNITYSEKDEKTNEVYEELFCDYRMMYKTVLHPEEIDILISVLEELQAQENN